MNKCEALFNLYKESPKISNADALSAIRRLSKKKLLVK